MGKALIDPKKKLRLAIWRRARAWVDIYRAQPDSERLIKSLLLGIESRIAQRAGLLPYELCGGPAPDGAISRAYEAGRQLAEEIPASLIPRP